MLLIVNDQPRGIRCDLTGQEQFDKFIYYSLEGTLVTVNSAKKNVQREPGMLDLDICAISYDELYTRVKTNLGPIKPGKVKCDLSAGYMAGNFQYWSIIISMVQVDLDSKDPMSVEKAIFDFNASLPPIAELIALKDIHRTKPFSAPKLDVPKREVRIITASPPISANPPKERQLQRTVIPEPEVDLTPQEITKPRPS